MHENPTVGGSVILELLAHDVAERLDARPVMKGVAQAVMGRQAEKVEREDAERHQRQRGPTPPPTRIHRLRASVAMAQARSTAEAWAGMRVRR